VRAIEQAHEAATGSRPYRSRGLAEAREEIEANVAPLNQLAKERVGICVIEGELFSPIIADRPALLVSSEERGPYARVAASRMQRRLWRQRPRLRPRLSFMLSRRGEGSPPRYPEEPLHPR